MARFDETRGAVVARILYDGLGTAGKTSSLRKLRELLSQRSGEIYVPEEANGRTLYFDWLEVDAGHFDGHRLRVELLTVPGQWAYAHRRFMLLGSSDAVIAVVDSSPHGLTRAAYALAFLRKALAAHERSPPLVVQAHKQDLAEAGSVDHIREHLAVPSAIPIVATSAETGEGLRHAFVLALQHARAHIRMTLAGAAAETLSHVLEPPESLCAEMRRAEREGAELEGERVLADVLDQLELARAEPPPER